MNRTTAEKIVWKAIRPLVDRIDRLWPDPDWSGLMRDWLDGAEPWQRDALLERFHSARAAIEAQTRQAPNVDGKILATDRILSQRCTLYLSSYFAFDEADQARMWTDMMPMLAEVNRRCDRVERERARPAVTPYAGPLAAE